jgi:hypothetical protein
MTAIRDGRRPDKSEYFEYYDRYVSLVPDGDVVNVLDGQLESTLTLLRGIPIEKVDYRYGPDKWTVAEVIRHVVDMEWVFTYRALTFARTATESLPGVDQDEFMAGARLAAQRWPDLVEEFRYVRSANLHLFAGFDDTLLNRGGVASGNHVTVRALQYIIAGHEIHHVNVLKERYLGQ